MSRTIKGQCACGAVRYASDGEIEFSFHCCCRKCQRSTGAGHASAFALPLDQIELTGEVRYFEQMSDSGYVTHSAFCPECGSPMFAKTAQYPNRLYINAATLDDPSTFSPGFVVFQEMAQPWDHLDPGLRAPGG